MTTPAKIDALTAVCETVASDAMAERIRQALPPTVTLERFTRVTLTAIQQNPDIVQGDRKALFSAIIRCAADGLLPDGREAALVAFGGKAQYMPMIGGLRKIAAKHGISLAAYVVYEGDYFEWQLGLEPSVVHKPPALSEQRGEAIGAYAVARDTEGQTWVEVMSRQEIEEVRKVSRAASSGPWRDWWGEMARKTVARRLFKQLPLGDLSETEARIVQAGDDEFEFQGPIGRRFTPPVLPGPDDRGAPPDVGPPIAAADPSEPAEPPVHVASAAETTSRSSRKEDEESEPVVGTAADATDPVGGSLFQPPEVANRNRRKNEEGQ